MKIISLWIAIFLSILSVINNQCLPNNPSCTTCQNYLINLFPLSIVRLCIACSANRSVNPQTNLCQCNAGYYELNKTSCQRCPETCMTCSSSTNCTGCYVETNRTLDSGTCSCIYGYQSKNNNIVCTQKPNVLMIVLSTIGSGLCIVLGFILCAFLRAHHSEDQIYDSNNVENTGEGAQIQPHQSSDVNQMDASNIFWNNKSFTYKKDQICSICLEDNPTFMTDCQHYFHSKCIYSWIKAKNICPNCNKQIEQKELRRWCDICKTVLMPIIMNIFISKGSKKSKKDQLLSTPIEHQLCEGCSNLKDARQQDDNFNEKDGTPQPLAYMTVLPREEQQ